MPETPPPLDLDALAAQWDAQAAHNADQGGDFWKGMVVKGRECADDLRRSLAAVREHLPVKPGRDEAAHLLFRAAGRDDWGVASELERDEWLDAADAVLALWPGRSEATVKAEAWDEGAEATWESSGEGWNGEYPPGTKHDVRNPYREGGADRG